MKRLSLLLPLVIFLLALAIAIPVSGQRGFVANPTPTPEQPRDTDGDGLPDTSDRCPDQRGSVDNNGCPQEEPTPEPTRPAAEQPSAEPTLPPVDQPDQPPADPTLPGEPPSNPDDLVPAPVEPTPARFVPPALTGDVCQVTPTTNNIVNVRSAPYGTASVIGSLNPNTVYEALGYVLVNTNEIWFVLLNYEGGPGPIGFGSRIALTANAECMQINISLQETSRGQTGNFMPLPTREGRDTDNNPGAADDLAISTPGPGLVEAPPECYYGSDGSLDVCGCSSSDGDCLSTLVVLCAVIGGQVEAGPDTVACWNDDANVAPAPVFDDFAVSTPGPGVLEAKPTCSGDLCWCSNADGECLVNLIANCQGEGDFILGGETSTSCLDGEYEEPDSSND